MPFYVVNGCRVHVKLSGRGKAPAPCVAGVGIETGRRQCLGISSYLCDAKVGGEGKTCDAPLCEAHATQVGRNRHLCPIHARQAQCAPQRGLFDFPTEATS